MKTPKPAGPTPEQLDMIRKCALVGLTLDKAARKTGVPVESLESGPGADAYLDGLIEGEYEAGQMLLMKAQEGDTPSIRQYMTRAEKAWDCIEPES